MTISINQYKIKDTNGRTFILDAGLKSVGGLKEFMMAVVYTVMGFYTYYQVGLRHKRTPSVIGKRLGQIQVYGDMYDSELTYHPLLKLFYKVYRTHDIRHYYPPQCGYDALGVQLMESFVANLRSVAIYDGVKKEVSDWDRKAQKNKDSVKAFVHSVFETTARVEALRLDFLYHAAKFTPAEVKAMIDALPQKIVLDRQTYLTKGPNEAPHYVEGRVSLEEVQKDRTIFFSNMKGKPSLFKHLVGYVWCIECGRAAGYHLHVMLLFNGAHVQNDAYLAQKIGEHWVKQTEGRGYFHNCNLEKSKSKEPSVLGRIEYFEPIQQEALINYLGYFCKSNQAVLALPKRRSRMFGTGFKHRKDSVRRGRPRMKTAIDSLNHRAYSRAKKNI